MKFSERMSCPNDHDIETDDLEPRSFSFNSPFGACPTCHGLGTRMEVDPELVISDPQGTLGEGVIGPWSGAHVSDYFTRLLGALGDELGFDLNTPWEDLPAKGRKAILEGHPTKVHVRHTNRYGRERSYYTNFEGVRPYIERRHREAESDTSRERFEGFMREVPCPACKGSRLKPVSMAVTLGDKDAGGINIAEVCHLPINETAEFLTDARAVHPRAPDRRAGAQGDPGAAALPARRRARLPLARPALGHAVGRRGPAHPAGHPDRRRAGRGALRPRRAEHRPAPARQPPADPDAGAAQGPRQHPDRRRARRGHHQDRRLGRRHRSGCGRARRPGGALRHRQAAAQAPRLRDRPLPLRTQDDPGARRTPPAVAGPRADRARRPREQPQGHRRLVPARHASSPSPASPARASRRWSTTSSTPRWPSRSTTPAPSPAGTARSAGSNTSTR